MNPTGWLRSTVLEERGLQFSDGRPLYAYHCRPQLFDAMGRQLLSAPQRIGQRVYIDEAWEPMFCLYAAEWWRRHYVSGPWAWAGIYESIGWEAFQGNEVGQRVTRGLKWWKREVIRQNNQYRYLVTVACEGGLPLRMLHRERQYLGTYFSEILQQSEFSRETLIETEVLAERLDDRLPKSLQQQTVYALAGQLVDAIVDCRKKLGGVVDFPLRQLDRVDPDWRSDFPLRLEDDVAQLLISGLLQQKIDRKTSVAHADICNVNRALELLDDNRWMSVLTVDMPSEVPHEMLLSRIKNAGLETLPQRIELRVRVGQKQYSFALLSKQDGVKNSWRAQFAPGNRPLRVTGKSAADGVELILAAGANVLGSWSPDGALPLSDDLPWCYASSIGEISESTRHVDWIGDGSIASKQAKVLLVIPEGAGLNAECEQYQFDHGVEASSDRSVWLVDQSVELTLQDEERCFVELGAREDELPVYRLVGDRQYFEMHSHPIYRALPRMYTSDGDDFSIVPKSDIFWRPFSKRSEPWRIADNTVRGDILIRHISERGIRLECRLVVLPSGATIDQISGTSGGEILLNNFQLEEVAVKGTQAASAAISEDSGNWCIGVKSNELALFSIPLVLSWRNHCRVTLKVPVPVTQSLFVRDTGEAVGFRSPVAIDELLGMRAVSIGTGIVESHLDVDLIEPGHHRHIGNICSFRVPLEYQQNGHHSLALGPLIPRLRRLMALSSELDTEVRLTIQPGALDQHIRVRIFQRRLMHQEGHLKLVGVGDRSDSVSVKAISLLEPGTVVELPYNSDEDCWLSASLDPAGRPWLAAAWAENMLVGRPCFVPVLAGDALGNNEVAESGLVTVLQIQEFRERNAAMDAIVDSMAKDPSHPGWKYLRDSLIEYRDFPLSGIDFVVRFSENPHALCMGLFCLKDIQDIYFSIADQLCFDWRLLTLDAWVESPLTYMRHLKSELPENMHDIAETSTFEKLTALSERIPDFEFLFTMIKKLLAGIVIDNSFARQFEQILVPGLRDGARDLVGRCHDLHLPDEVQPDAWNDFARQPGLGEFPAWEAIAELAPHTRAVLSAPVLAGERLCHGDFPSTEISSYYMAMREFDMDWFDNAIAQVLVWGFLNRDWAEVNND